MAAKGQRVLSFSPDEGDRVARRLDLAVGPSPTPIGSVDEAIEIIRSKKIQGDEEVEALAMLSFGVELSRLQPPPGARPLDTSWLVAFIESSVEKLKSARGGENPDFSRKMDEFETKMKGHTYTMNVSDRMRANMIRNIDRIAEEYLGDPE